MNGKDLRQAKASLGGTKVFPATITHGSDVEEAVLAKVDIARASTDMLVEKPRILVGLILTLKRGALGL